MAWRPWALAALLITTTLTSLPTATATEATDDASVTVAILSTGIRATHEHFDYVASGGDGSGPAGDLVAWWDFTRGLPGEGETWMTDVAPYDLAGTGTTLASIIAGELHQRSDRINLAVAKIVPDDDQAFVEEQEAAYDWAVHTAGADLVLIGWGTLAPTHPHIFGDVEASWDEQVAAAMDAGALTFGTVGPAVEAGGFCVPTGTHHSDPWTSNEGVVGVGSSLCPTAYPDMIGTGYTYDAADASGDQETRSVEGRIIATTTTVADAAGLLLDARDKDLDLGPADLRDLMFRCAEKSWFDTSAAEGHGTWDREDSMDAARLDLFEGETCTREVADPEPPNPPEDRYLADVLKFVDETDRFAIRLLAQHVGGAIDTLEDGMVEPALADAHDDLWFNAIGAGTWCGLRLYYPDGSMWCLEEEVEQVV